MLKHCNVHVFCKALPGETPKEAEAIDIPDDHENKDEVEDDSDIEAEGAADEEIESSEEVMDDDSKQNGE